MLNTSRVLKFIKHELGHPFVQIEFEDKDIVENFQEYSLREFSSYVPDKNIVNLNLGLAINKVPSKQNEYYITDPDNIEILNVIDIIFPATDLYIHGHPIYGPMTHYELREWALATEMSNETKMYSSWDKTFEFKHPNVVRISPIPSEHANCAIEYERIQPEDLRGIPNEFQILFCEFATADIMIRLGRVRKKYGDGRLTTPFGEIPLGSEILEEGKEKKRELLEKLERLSLPNVSIDHG